MLEITYTECKNLLNNGVDLAYYVQQFEDMPVWISQEDIIDTIDDLEAIYVHGCPSGCFMPAVTNSTAIEAMAEHGDEILSYIQECYGELENIDQTSWSGLCINFYSMAVELYASQFTELFENRH